MNAKKLEKNKSLKNKGLKKKPLKKKQLKKVSGGMTAIEYGLVSALGGVPYTNVPSSGGETKPTKPIKSVKSEKK